ncbi:MAG: hypothetical protein ACFC1C_03800 [Candidatus Malihini olakiniferum]
MQIIANDVIGHFPPSLERFYSAVPATDRSKQKIVLAFFVFGAEIDTDDFTGYTANSS